MSNLREEREVCFAHFYVVALAEFGLRKRVERAPGLPGQKTTAEPSPFCENDGLPCPRAKQSRERERDLR